MEGDEDDMEDDYEEDDEEVEYYDDDDEEESEGGIVEDIKDVVEDKVDGEKEEVRMGIRGVTIPLFNGFKSGSGIAKKKAENQTPDPKQNHNTSTG